MELHAKASCIDPDNLALDFDITVFVSGRRHGHCNGLSDRQGQEAFNVNTILTDVFYQPFKNHGPGRK